MQENNFEKQVQEKLDELKLQPSAEVWEKVAVSIRKRKSNRRILVIFLLLLCIAPALFVVWNRADETQHPKDIAQNNNKIKPATISGSLSSGVPGNIAAADKMISDKEKNRQVGTSIATNKASITITGKPSITSINNPPLSGKDSLNKKNTISYKTRPKLNSLISKGTIADQIITGTFNPTDQSIAEARITDSASVSINRLINRLKDTMVTIPTVTTKNDTASKSYNQTQKNKKWRMGISFSGGIASINNNYLGIGSGTSDEMKYVAEFSQSNGNTAGQATFTPSKVKPSAGYSVGVFIQKDVFDNIAVFAGLNYKQYSTVMLIGSRIDSSNIYSRSSFFYRAGNNSTYTNHFHFVELPVAIQITLGKQNKLPLYLNTGFSIARLLASSALQFEPRSGAYYRDNSVFNKTQVSITAALFFSLSRQATNPFLIGPDINFSINKTANTGLYQDRRYSYFGLKAQKVLGNK